MSTIAGNVRRTVSAVSTMVAMAAMVAVAACDSPRDGAAPDGRRSPEPESGPIMPTVERRADGVEVHTFPADVFERAPMLALDSTPLATAGGAAGSREFDLTNASDVKLLSDGRIVAFASVGARLLVFEADGREARVIGRIGKGPGEFMRPGGFAVLPGDTLFLSDMANNRLNWVMPEGKFVRTPAMDWVRASQSTEDVVGVLPGGRVVLSSSGLVSWTESDTVFRSNARVVVQPMTGAGREIALVPDLATISTERRIRGAQTRINEVLMFTPRAHLTLWDTLIATSTGERYAVTSRNAEGKVLREMSIPVQTQPVTPAMIEASLSARLAAIDNMRGEGGGGDTYTKDEMKEGVRQSPRADSLPVISSMLVGEDGLLWIGHRTRRDGADSTVMTAFRRDGAMVGRLTLGGDRSPVAIGADRIVLRERDADDVVALRVYRIAPASR